MKKIEAHIPATEIRKAGKVWKTEARTVIFKMDNKGRWRGEGYGPMFESEVIDICKKATNWPEIRSKFFPMEGFHR